MRQLSLPEKLDPTNPNRIAARSSFDCQNPKVNAFLKQFASQDQSQFLNATFLCFDESEMFEETNEQPKREIIGYYTLAQFSLHKAELEDVAIKTGKYAVVPAILLGWFGVNQAFQG